MSGVGKGTTISAIGSLLKAQGNEVTAIKIDPYLNVDAGTMSPAEHGEVYVLDDGGEVDLDLGNYERALGITFTKDHNITSGKVFMSILTDERRGKYLGKTIQMIPHVTDRIKEMIENTAENYRTKDGKKANICLVEIGGTVGDLESGIFFEAIRQFINDKGDKRCAIITLSYVPMIGSIKEPKTKPTQHGIKELKSLGLFPNFIISRSEFKIDKKSLQKIADNSNTSIKNIGNCYNVDNLYTIPLILHDQGIDTQILNYFNLPIIDKELHFIKKIIKVYEKILKDSKEYKVVLVGKYCKNHDSYYSVIKALENAALLSGVKVSIKQIEAEVFDDLEIDDNLLETNFVENNQNKRKMSFTNKDIQEHYKDIISADGIIVPGGFGNRGISSLIKIIKIVILIRLNLII